MSDDPERPSGRPADDQFSDALDDLFGPDEPTSQARANANPAPQRQEKQVRYSPPAGQANPTPGTRPVSEHNANPAPSYPARPSNASVAQPGRSIARILALGCGAIVAITVACMAILLVIGLVAGEDSSASTIDEPSDSMAEVDPGHQEETLAVAVADMVQLDTFAPVNSTFRVAVNDVIPDATQMVLDRNPFNTPPEEGHLYFVANVSIRNTGPFPATFDAMLLLRAVSQDGHEYTSFSDFCGVVPEGIMIETVPSGETLVGNVCWQVASEDAESLVMLSSDFIPGFRVQYFALHR